MDSVEEKTQLHKGLLASDDVSLFTQGGCHVFALALHDRFSYPIRVIPGRDNEKISHVYCRVAGPPDFAVDVVGFTIEDDRVWKDFSGLCVRSIDRSGLLALFRPLREGGMCGDDWFVKPARERADRRIEKYIDIFSGKRKVRIPGHGTPGD